MTSPYNPDPPETTPVDFAAEAAELVKEWRGEPRVVKQLASGVAVHFGDFSQFVPGDDPDKLLLRIGERLEGLACAYLAYEYAVKNERTEVS